MRRMETRTVTQPVVVATVCDSCGKVTDDAAEGWLHFMSGHGEWGNDSVDSVEWHDACSAACFLAIASRVVDEYSLYPTLTVADFNLTFLKDLLAICEPRPKGKAKR